jgi:hypothetical protein
MKTVKNLSDFLEILEKIRKNRQRGHELFFRGHEDANYKMEPSIYRNKKYISNEYKLFKEIVLEHPNEFSKDSTTLEKLVRMQHYGLPTRILDITKNPLVALYFACSDQDGKVSKDKNGEVVVLSIPNNEIKYYDSDSVSLLSNLCKLKTTEKKFDFNLEQLQFNEQENVYKLIHGIREEKSYFSNSIVPNDLNDIFCVKVKKNNARIIIQNGLFLVFGLRMQQEILEKEKKWIISSENQFKIIIAKENKYKIKDELELIDITNKSLFPELENNIKMLRKKYI